MFIPNIKYPEFYFPLSQTLLLQVFPSSYFLLHLVIIPILPLPSSLTRAVFLPPSVISWVREDCVLTDHLTTHSSRRIFASRSILACSRDDFAFVTVSSFLQAALSDNCRQHLRKHTHVYYADQCIICNLIILHYQTVNCFSFHSKSLRTLTFL